MTRPSIAARWGEFKRSGNFCKERSLAVKVSKLLLAFPLGIAGREARGTGILCERTQRGQCEAQAGPALVENSKALGVALKCNQVGPLMWRDLSREVLSSPEVFGDGILAGMTERRIAQVVGKRCRGNYGAEIKQGELCLQLRVTLDNRLPYSLAERASNARHFQAVREAGVYKVILRKRVDLRFILQASKRMRKNYPVVILLEGAA